jgi:hypothetical protein
MPPRTAPMPRSAFRPPVASRPVITSVDLGPGTAPPRTRRGTGFSAVTRLAIRTRAGGGDPEQARCEQGWEFLGLHGGEYQHRRARGRGGSRDPLTNTCANGVLLCHEHHAIAESRDRESNEAGFWLWSWQSPLAEPILLAGADGGIRVWLSEDGAYSTTAPEAE